MAVSRCEIVGSMATARERKKSWADGRYLACIGAAVCIIGFGLGLTSRAATAVQSGYRIVQLKKQLVALQNENEFLEAEVAQMQSLSRIESIARGKLNMRPPDEMRVAQADQEWQSAMALKSEESFRTEQSSALVEFFGRLASGARTAQAKPAR